MTISELHDKLFEVLCLVDDICQKEGIRWFLDGGTEIGSVREKDFIAWDDDIDAKILREDYPKFKDALIRNLPEQYKFIEPEEFEPYFFDFVPRIIDTTQLLREVTDEDKAYKNYQNCVGLDIFILETAPQGALARKMMMLKCKMLYGMAMSKRYKNYREKYTLTQKIVTSVCMFMGRFVSHKGIFKKWNRAMTKYSKKNTDWVLPANFPLQYMGFYRREWYESMAYGEIRGRKFPIPVGYDAELTAIYGEYMKPPKDKSIYKTHL